MHLRAQFNRNIKLGGDPMENKICFMFGHATTPYMALPLIEAAAERHYKDYGIPNTVKKHEKLRKEGDHALV